MASPFIIYLPVRNGGRFVAQAVASIVAQTDPDWQLVVLENCSTDDTRATVEAFGDPRVTIIAADRPLDIADNWHRILHNAAALDDDTLLTFIGHDDYLLPEFVARIRALAAAEPRATLYQTHCNLINQDGALIRPSRPVPRREEWQDLAAAMFWGMRDAYGTGYAVRARDYRAVGGMPQLPGILYADHLLFLRLTKYGFKIADSAIGCAYRLHAASMSNAVSAEKTALRLDALCGFVAALDAEFSELGSTDKGRAALTTLLSTELFVFGAPLVRATLPATHRAKVDALRQRLYALGGSDDPHHWAYRTSRIARSWGRFKMQAPYARALLRQRIGR